MGLRLTTKVQVSGWRFLLRRLEHALVRRDTRMFDDPLQYYGRSMTVGIVIAALILLGAVVLAYFKPQGKLGTGDLFADNSTYQLYVNLSARLHPVYNLTSARLILGKPADPALVNSAELADLPKAQPVGIPGAPYATPVAASTESSWAVCDTLVDPRSSTSAVQTSVLGMPVVSDPATTDPIQPNEVLLASFAGQEWLITDLGRHALDRTNRALTSSLGLPNDALPLPVSESLFNAVPDAGPWQLPEIPLAGQPNTLGLPPEAVIGSVFETFTPTGPDFYVVLPDSVAEVNDITAQALRAQQSYGLVAPPIVDSSLVVTLPETDYPSPLPEVPVTLLTRDIAPTLCWTWTRDGGEEPTTAVMAGTRLPIDPAGMNTAITQIQGSATVYTYGEIFLQVAGPDAQFGEALYYVDPQGTRYGIADQQTAGILGLSAPQLAPWPVVHLLVEGPALSRAAALLEHDTLPADPDPRQVQGAGS